MGKFKQIEIYKTLSKIFPKQNDFNFTDLLNFEINTNAKLFDLISKHREVIMEIDASELSELDIPTPTRV